ncbi:MAG: hypothetical protein KBT68_09460 [bacterium]|nr:hypothetical protein [Candidatus Colisoma equi]
MKKVMMVGAVACALPLFAKIEMGTPFSDGAVLQRGMEVPVWGVADPGKQVTVAFADAEVSAIAGADGKWMVKLPKMCASKESRMMTVTEGESGWFGSTTDTVEVKDVLVGEVWFASGQSNMECPIWGGGTRYRDGKGGLMTTMTFLPYVRFAKNNQQWKELPTKAKSQGWKKYEPSSFQGYMLSAVAFYYARELYLALDVPVGIVDASWGGTNIDAWTPRAGYEGCDKSIQATADYPVKAKWDAKTDRRGPIGGAHQQPTVLFNGMVSSWTPMAMRGFIWYQGCHNSGESALYCAKLHALYAGWAKAFANPDLKLYLVQLAPFNQNWMGICTAQNKFVAEEKNAAIAVTADVGNFDDIHPNDKEVVAKRLAVHALKRDYGFAIAEDDSPVVRSAQFGADGVVAIDFAHVRNWYVYAPNRSRDAAFEVAGTNGVWAAAKIVNYRKVKDKAGKSVDTDYIDEPKIAVRADSVAAPVKVRYMGKPRTAGTLYNEASLPLGPFEVAK